MLDLQDKKKYTQNWFKKLREKIISEFEQIEYDYLTELNKNQVASHGGQHNQYSQHNQHSQSGKPEIIKFARKKWHRKEPSHNNLNNKLDNGLNSSFNSGLGKSLNSQLDANITASKDSEDDFSDNAGGGEMAIMKGNVFEKVGVNFSVVRGEFSDEFKKEMPGTNSSRAFFATGISLVAHMHSPLVPAVHMNTRFIATEKTWFGGGADLTPMFEDKHETTMFHQEFKNTCDRYNTSYYPKFKKACDEYFHLKHRGEARGVGGIFYDYLNTNNFDEDFNFTKDVGKSFLNIYPKLVRQKMFKNFSAEQKEFQLYKRGRYVEFNLLYDRGTRFGLMTGGNIDAIMMSLPPVAKWV